MMPILSLGTTQNMLLALCAFATFTHHATHRRAHGCRASDSIGLWLTAVDKK
jgi:hypothetical protein